MKNPVYPRIVLLVVTLLITTMGVSTKSSAQDNKLKTNYVVVAVYSQLAHTERYIQTLSDDGVEANYVQFGYPNKRKLYYVYVYQSDQFSASLTESRSWREKSGFEDAWVFVSSEQPGNVVAKQEEEAETSEEHESMVASAEEETEEQVEEFDDLESGEALNQMTEEQISAEEDLPSEFEEGVKEVVEEDLDDGTHELADEQYYKIYTNAFHTRDLLTVPSTVKMVDGSKPRLLAFKHTNELIYFEKEKDPGYPVQFICEAFGYKKQELDVDLSNPESDVNGSLVYVKNDTIFVNCELTQRAVGDTLVMYNVFFYKDSNVMKSKSKFELNSLLELMQQNSGFRISIQGHTNGNNFGKIVKLDQEQDNLFKVTKDCKKSMGSAKELSRLRAQSVMRYLNEEGGIDLGRMDIVGMGGKKMLYDKNSPQAVKNIRVEVVILEDMQIAADEGIEDDGQ
ncbi:MAG: OmpA family protein [Bacteroidota bacterium]